MPFEKTLDNIADKDQAIAFIDLFINDDEVVKLEVKKKDQGSGFEGTLTIE